MTRRTAGPDRGPATPASPAGTVPVTVWAPHAAQVDLEWSPVLPPAGEQAADRGAAQPLRAPMVAADDGWWCWEPGAGDEGAGTTYPIEYAFVLDGDQPAIPDPRSAWQPHGVHGPSRTFDTSGFGWGDAGWPGPRGGAGILGAVVYELHVGTFTDEGTLDAAIGRLDHLVELGVDVVELMPVAAFPGRWNWGYDGVSLYSVHDGYGGPLALQRFVDACHGRGLGVCLDVVHNHLGPAGNYLARFGPYFTSAHQTPWGPAVNLDHEGRENVRAFLVDNAVRWLRDFHVDALRLDAVHELKDDSDPHYLAELSDAVADLSAELGRPLDLVAESDLNDPVMVTPTSRGGRGMSAQWDDDVHHALHVSLTGERHGYYADFGGGAGRDEGGPLAVLAKVLTRGFLHDGTMSTFRGRPWGRPVDVEELDARRLLGYLQTHDQVGNRMNGDRISASVSPGLQAVGAALYLLAPTTPMIFMGEEWAASTPWQFFTAFEDEALAEAVRIGRRAEFGSHGWSEAEVPDPQDPATRDRSVLDWSQPGQRDHARVLQWYAACIRLRRDLLGRGPTRFVDVRVEVDEDARSVVMAHRPAGRSAYAVVANLAERPQDVPVPGGPGTLLLAWDPDATAVGAETVTLPAGAAAVLTLP